MVKKANIMKNQASISVKPINLIEMYANDNYLDEPQDTEFKWRVINIIKGFKVFKKIQRNSEKPKHSQT